MKINVEVGQVWIGIYDCCSVVIVELTNDSVIYSLVVGHYIQDRKKRLNIMAFVQCYKYTGNYIS